ncbi:MAG: YegS/Rv2252/BmrU family lipid kinase [Rhodoluna sp.]|nr:YegS/Rv2252/BmrU family lipid kinase [Rhodoluna sp.]
MSTFGVILNPTSGKGKGLVLGKAFVTELQKLGVEVIDLSGSDYDEASENGRKAIAAGAIDALAVAGGDGMVHLGVNLCAETPVPLAIMPCGTGNDAAMTLGIPIDDAAGAAELAVSALSNPVVTDLGLGVTSSRRFYFFNSASAGFDAIVNKRANRWKYPKGPSRYTIAMLYELITFNSLKYRAKINGEDRDIDGMLCAIANGPSYGGGMLVAPEATVDDGFLDLFIVHKITKLELIKVFPKVFTGQHVSHPAVEIIRATEVKLVSEGVPVYADGEAAGQLPMTVSIAANALRVLAKPTHSVA